MIQYNRVYLMKWQKRPAVQNAIQRARAQRPASGNVLQRYRVINEMLDKKISNCVSPSCRRPFRPTEKEREREKRKDSRSRASRGEDKRGNQKPRDREGRRRLTRGSVLIVIRADIRKHEKVRERTRSEGICARER